MAFTIKPGKPRTDKPKNPVTIPKPPIPAPVLPKKPKKGR